MKRVAESLAVVKFLAWATFPSLLNNRGGSCTQVYRPVEPNKPGACEGAPRIVTIKNRRERLMDEACHLLGLKVSY
jgi:hypothetical protein